MKPGVDIAFVAGYMATDWIAAMHDGGTIGITPWNPSIGLALAWLILRGPNRAVALVLAMLAMDFVVRPLPGAPAARACSDLLLGSVYGAAAAALKVRFGLDQRLARLHDLMLLLSVSASVAAVLALLNVGLFVGADLIAPADYLEIVLRQWVGDMIGIAIVTPPVLRAHTWRAPPFGGRPSRLAIEAGAAAVATAIFVWIVFGWEGTDEYKVFYLLFLPVVAIAVRRGLDGACLALLFAQMAMIVVVHYRGFGSAEVTDFQLLMLSLAVIGLLTGAVVSERERAEQATREFERRLRESQGELEHVSRLSALGEMASTLAHELNQPMTATRAYVRVAQRMLADEAASGQRGGRSRAMDAIASAISQVDLAGAIVRNLRDMVRRRTITREPVDLGELAHQSLTLVRSQAQFTQIRVSIRKRPDVPAVLAERIRIQQVIMNLLRNAIDAVRAAPVERREVTIDIVPAAPGQVEVAIRDRGPGVSPDVRDNLFAAFTTTKPEGLGLGLSICRSIVQAHGGRMWLESTGPEGSDFRFTLPVAGDMIRS